MICLNNKYYTCLQHTKSQFLSISHLGPAWCSTQKLYPKDGDICYRIRLRDHSRPPLTTINTLIFSSERQRVKVFNYVINTYPCSLFSLCLKDQERVNNAELFHCITSVLWTLFARSGTMWKRNIRLYISLLLVAYKIASTHIRKM